MKIRTKYYWILIGLTLSFSIQAPAQDSRPPIIDMHLHANDFDTWGLAQPGELMSNLVFKKFHQAAI